MKHPIAKDVHHISVMDEHRERPPAPTVALLYIDTGLSDYSVQVPQHVHDYWQMEVVLSGSVHIKSPYLNQVVKNHTVIIIPPEIEHGYSYKQLSRTWSIKFTIQDQQLRGGLQPMLLPDNNPCMSLMCQALFDMVERLPGDPSQIHIHLEYLLGAILRIAYLTEENYKIQPQWLVDIRDLLATESETCFSIEQIADKLGYSRVHLSRLFKAHTGISIKKFYDQDRAEIARRKLLYTDLSIGDISRMMGFSCIYSFSHFFKRVTGQSPSMIRAGTKVISK